jgi:hypothetical protein
MSDKIRIECTREELALLAGALAGELRSLVQFEGMSAHPGLVRERFRANERLKREIDGILERKSQD